MCCVADLAGGFVLSILVGVGSSLGEEYNKQHSQSEGQHPGPAPYGFSPKSHKPCHFNTASDWTRRPSHSNRNFVSFEAISESVPHGVLISGLDKWLENESHFRMGKSCSG